MISTTFGVLQVSVMGPILFKILVDVFSLNVSCSSTIYADEMSLLVSHKDIVQSDKVATSVLNEANN